MDALQLLVRAAVVVFVVSSIISIGLAARAPRLLRRGGSGANLIVDWVAEVAVSDPIGEAATAGIASIQAVSFMRNGQVISTKGANA